MVCTQELGIRFSPRDTIIAPGQSFVATAATYTCGGTVVVPSTNIWGASDTTVLAVDSLSGRVTGRKIGQANVLLRSTNFGVAIPVIVR
jgi:hypothetical protein